MRKRMLPHVALEFSLKGGQVEADADQMLVPAEDLDEEAALRRANVDN